MKLFHKFLAFLLLAALGPLALSGAGFLAKMERSVRRSGLEAQRAVARRTAESVAAYLENVRSLLTIVQKTPGFWDGRTLGGRAVFKALLDNYPAFEDVAVFSRGGEAVYRLRRFNDGAPPFSPARGGMDPAAGGDPFLAWDLERDARGRPLLPVSVPITDAEGKTQGHLAGRLNLLDLGARLKGLDLETGGRALLFDGKGALAGHSSGRDLFAEGVSVPPSVLAADWREGEYEDAAGRRLLGVKAAVPGTDWAVLFELPAAVAFKAVDQARAWILRVLLLSGVLAAALCLWLTRLVVRRLRLIQDAVEEMAEGRFLAALPVGDSDEVGRLARKIREARGILERKVRQATIGRLAFHVGHDLRQPLINIRNSLDLVVAHAPGMDPVARKHMGLIQEEILQGLEAVEDVLTLGRERPPNLSTERVGDLVAAWAARLRPPEGASLSAEVPEDLPACRVDARELSRAFFNAARNALEAVGAGGRVEVRARAEGERLWISVSDDGPGIPAGDRERIFDDFFTTKPHGTGLGMGIIRRVMERHGGAVRLGERPGGGTVLELGLPALAVEVRVP